ncbi:MAG: FHA domain-containing protein [Anaerolineales bacterium]|nr:FHA domain-containing protein [Anaerolineales bacterium]
MARAQAPAQVELVSLSAEGFPIIAASFRPYDGEGNFVYGLAAADVAVMESGNPHPVNSLEQLQPGVQFVVALNTGPGLATRNAQAISRLDGVLTALRGWADARPADNPDDLSLVTSDSYASTHLSSPAAFLDLLAGYQTDARNVAPTLDTLSRAIDIAAEPTPRPDMRRVVLFISPIPDVDAIPILQSLAARADELGVCIHVWIVASRDYFNTTGATALKDVAIRTDGTYFTYSGEETLPDPDSYLAPFRDLYRLTYLSTLTTSGEHSLSVLANLDGQPAVSNPRLFSLDVQPPNPMFVSPPDQIVRRVPDITITDLTALEPATQVVEVLVEFPDGHTRPLVRTTLYVDDQIADENLEPPFELFAWDLSGYTSSGQHMLRVEAVDTLGLSQVTLGVPVTVTVIQPPSGLMIFLTRNVVWVVLGAVGVAGVILTLVLLLGGRRRSGRGRSRRNVLDPVTQPIPRADVNRSARPPWSRRAKPAPAYLQRLRPDGQPMTAPPIPLVEEQITFGTDPTKAERLVSDPSVSPLHARLIRKNEDEYYVKDEKSVAGTWVNYEPVSGEPRRLVHGDVIQIGQLSYRFLYNKPPERPGPRLITEKK